MSAFFRFPHTPHIAWPGAGIPRDDKVLTKSEAEEFLANSVVIEEKVDGANLGFSVGSDGAVRAQNLVKTTLDRVKACLRQADDRQPRNTKHTDVHYVLACAVSGLFCVLCFVFLYVHAQHEI